MQLLFTPIKISDKPLFDSFFNAQDTVISVNDFATVFNWNISGQAEYAILGDALIMANVFMGTRVYYCPVLKNGGDIRPYIEAIYAYENGREHIIAQITEKQKQNLEDIKGYRLISDREFSDYIYNAQDFVTFAGKKFHQKRNFVNRFTSKYTYNFRPLTSADYSRCMDLYAKWQGSNHTDAASEKVALELALKNFDALGLYGTAIEIDGKMAAYQIFSIDRKNSVAHIHFEKADTNYVGIYPAIVNLTAARYFTDLKYVNRQEDMGIEGLRKSKLSYNPVFILNKYRLKSKSEQ